MGGGWRVLTGAAKILKLKKSTELAPGRRSGNIGVSTSVSHTSALEFQMTARAGALGYTQSEGASPRPWEGLGTWRELQWQVVGGGLLPTW